MPDPSLLNLISNYQDSAWERGNQEARALLKHYTPVRERLIRSIRALTDELSGLSPEQRQAARLYHLSRYQELLRQVEQEMSAVAERIGKSAFRASKEAAGVGIDAAEELVRRYGVPPGGAPAFTQLPAAQMAEAVALVTTSPLQSHLQESFGKGWANVFAAEFTAGVALGLGSDEIARRMINTLTTAVPADIMRNVRTAQADAYNSANFKTWENMGVVSHWIWSSSLDSNCCASCWALHGTVHPISEKMKDHYNGRCAPVPQVKTGNGWYARDMRQLVGSGESIFKRLSEEQQAAIAQDGGWVGLFRAWKSGLISFSQMSATRHSDVYGDMRCQASLTSLGLRDMRVFSRDKSWDKILAKRAAAQKEEREIKRTRAELTKKRTNTGKPHSKGYNIAVEGADLKQTVKNVLSYIEEVHRLPKGWKTIDIVPNRISNAAAVLRRDGSVVIELAKGLNNGYTVLHELGHAFNFRMIVEKYGIKAAQQYAVNKGKAVIPNDPALQAVISAAENSALYKKMTAKKDEYARYWAQPCEVFARAYAQLISDETNTYKNTRQGIGANDIWSQKDFEEIAKAMKNYIRTYGKDVVLS